MERYKRVGMWILAALASAGILAASHAAGEAQATYAQNGLTTVVIDPGHGGGDHGASGSITGVREDVLNLEVSFALRDLLLERGYHVVMTRESENIDVTDMPGNGFKKKDMQRRRRIIMEADADVVISIHMNRYTSPQPRGAQVFYAEGSEAGKELAACMQTHLRSIDGSDGRRKAAVGDYFILRSVEATGVLVECGFLSHPEEEQRLQDASYREDLARAIADGLRDYENASHAATREIGGRYA